MSVAIEIDEGRPFFDCYSPLQGAARMMAASLSVSASKIQRGRSRPNLVYAITNGRETQISSDGATHLIEVPVPGLKERKFRHWSAAAQFLEGALRPVPGVAEISANAGFEIEEAWAAAESMGWRTPSDWGPIRNRRSKRSATLTCWIVPPGLQFGLAIYGEGSSPIARIGFTVEKYFWETAGEIVNKISWIDSDTLSIAHRPAGILGGTSDEVWARVRDDRIELTGIPKVPEGPGIAPWIPVVSVIPWDGAPPST